eukprot:scaffold111574_cov33-Attheya_sp.AAC.2
MFAKSVTVYHFNGASWSLALALSSPSEMVQHTAERILRAAISQKFVMAFAGYSVTVARGNRIEQSFPFAVQNVLAFDLLGIALTVRNPAIGEIPSLAYAWYMHNVLGSDADVISWDFGLVNEGNGAQYVNAGVLHDPVALGQPSNIKGMIGPKFLFMSEEERPEGYQHWDDWHSPCGSPGQNSWHPNIKSMN